MVWAFYEKGYVRRTGARYNDELDYWTSLVLSFLDGDRMDECRDRIVCEANVYFRNYSLLQIVSLGSADAGTDIACGTLESKRSCAVTVGDLVLRKLSYLKDYVKSTNGVT